MSPLKRSVTLAVVLIIVSLFCLPVAAQRRTTPARTPSPARTTSAPRTPPAARAETPPQPTAPTSSEIDRPVDTTISADSYAFYIEVRRIGQLARSKEIKTAIDMFRLTSEAPRELTDVIDFVTANDEVLSDARVVVTAGRARADVPEFVLAVQFLTPDAARTFEPRFRAFFKDPTYDTAATTVRGRVRRPRPKSNAAPTLYVYRAGSWIYAADSKFTLKSLGGEGDNYLTSNNRLMSYRSQFASESVFVFYDQTVLSQTRQLEREISTASTVTIQGPPPTPEAEIAAEVKSEEASAKPAEATEPTEDEPKLSGEGEAEMTGETDPETPSSPPNDVETTAPAVVRAPSPEERVAQTLKHSLLRGIFEGGPSAPEAAAFAAGFEGDAIAVRALVPHNDAKVAAVIPFFPSLIAGPPLVPQSLSVAPADSEVYITTTFDWVRIYESLVEKIDARQEVVESSKENTNENEEANLERSNKKNAAQMIEAFEKLLGFKLKEEILPALGNEVAVSLPLDFFEGQRTRTVTVENTSGSASGVLSTEERKASPGPAVFVAMSNPETVQKVVPTLLMILGQLGPGQTEKRKGHELHDLGVFAYSFINNFLVVCQDAPALRHVIDSVANGSTLAASTSFRDSNAWQKQQRLATAFVSDGLMKSWSEAAKRQASGSTDFVVLAAVAQLNETPAAVSYGAALEGEAVFHEIRVPIGFLKVAAASMLIGTKEAPNTNSEMMALYALNEVVSAEEVFKRKRGGRYGSFEELIAAKVLDKGTFENNQNYSIELRASGSGFSVTATPKTYGKTGRRSFFIDETKKLRGSDHKGAAATAADPILENEKWFP